MDAPLNQLIRQTESEIPPTRAELEECYSEAVGKTLEQLTRARETEDASMFGVVMHVVDQLRNELRESVQALTSKPMREIIAKLQDGSPIGADEMRMIRLWIVGDADAYIREENNVDDWRTELDRLIGEIRRLQSGPVDVDTLEELSALLTDAHGVARSLEQYLADRERVMQFEKNTAGTLDREAREILAGILRRSYESPSI